MAVAAGEAHSVFLTDRNTVYCVGSNHHGELGAGVFGAWRDDACNLVRVRVRVCEHARCVCART